MTATFNNERHERRWRRNVVPHFGRLRTDGFATPSAAVFNTSSDDDAVSFVPASHISRMHANFLVLENKGEMGDGRWEMGDFS